MNVLLYYVGHGISHKDHTFAVLPVDNGFFDLTAFALNLAGYKNVRVWSFFDCCRDRGDGDFDPPEVDDITPGDKCYHILHACELHDATGHSVNEGEPTPRTKAWTAALRSG